MFWPTMMTESMTSWMNVWLTHWMIGSSAALERLRERDEGEDPERVSAPHRPDGRRQDERDLAVEADVLVGGLGRADLLALRDPRVGVVLEEDRHARLPGTLPAGCVPATRRCPSSTRRPAPALCRPRPARTLPGAPERRSTERPPGRVARSSRRRGAPSPGRAFLRRPMGLERAVEKEVVHDLEAARDHERAARPRSRLRRAAWPARERPPRRRCARSPSRPPRPTVRPGRRRPSCTTAGSARPSG